MREKESEKEGEKREKRANLNNEHLNRVIRRGSRRHRRLRISLWILSVRFLSPFLLLSLSRHEIYKRFSLRDLISELNRKVSVRSKNPRERTQNLEEEQRKQSEGKRRDGERWREREREKEKARSIKSAQWIRPQCRCKEESPSLEPASERKLKNAEERNKRTLSPKEDAELRSERDETAVEKENDAIGTGERTDEEMGGKK